MKILDHCVICTAYDEEPDCMMCDYCQSSVLCKECGPEHWWQYYEREEEDSKMNKLVRALENLGFEKSKRRFK